MGEHVHLEGLHYSDERGEINMQRLIIKDMPSSPLNAKILISCNLIIGLEFRSYFVSGVSRRVFPETIPALLTRMVTGPT